MRRLDPRSLRRLLPRSHSSPAWALPVLLFAILYVPFVHEHGWRDRWARSADLRSFHTASVVVFGHSESPYDHARLERYADHEGRTFPFLYPPPSLLLFAPLAGLSYEAAWRVALGVNHLVFLFLVWVIPLGVLGLGFREDTIPLSLSLVYTLTFYPIVATLAQGQVNLLLLASLVGFWLLARRGAAVPASLLLAGAVLLKTYPAVFVPLLVLVGRWREAVFTVGWLGVAGVASLLLLPVDLWREWIWEVVPSGGYMSNPEGLWPAAGVWNQSVNGFVARLFTDTEWSHPVTVDADAGRWLAYAVAAGVLGVSAFLVWRSRDRDDSLDRMMLVGLPAVFLVAPFSWEHHLTYVLPACLMLLCGRSGESMSSGGLLYGLSVLTTIAVSMSNTIPFKFVAVALLWGLCCVAVWRTDAKMPTGPALRARRSSA